MNKPGILILGASGFVGGQLLKRLSTEGYDKLHAITPHTADTLPGVTYYHTSLDDIDLLRRLLPECDWVIHAACASTPGLSALRPVFEAEENLLPSLRFLQILQDYPDVRLIYLSTGGALYGNPDPTIPLVTESLSTAPLSYYGAGKAALEQFVIAFCNQQQRPSIILRPANFYGPQQAYKPGFGIIPTIFHRLKEGLPLQIWGNGQAVRDYLFIDDFIDLCLRLIERPLPRTQSKIYNVGSQQGTSLIQLCDLIEQVTGTPVQREHLVSRSVDVQRVVLNCGRVYKDYDWKARTDLLKGLHATWTWFKTRGMG
ncbi:MAG: NAD-dependent epimerase/dehydratase family protein [Gammaproteobacteria bacterium]